MRFTLPDVGAVVTSSLSPSATTHTGVAIGSPDLRNVVSETYVSAARAENSVAVIGPLSPKPLRGCCPAPISISSDRGRNLRVDHRHDVLHERFEDASVELDPELVGDGASKYPVRGLLN